MPRIPEAVLHSRLATLYLTYSESSAPEVKYFIGLGATNIKPMSEKHPSRKFQITLRSLAKLMTNRYTECCGAAQTNTRSKLAQNTSHASLYCQYNADFIF